MNTTKIKDRAVLRKLFTDHFRDYWPQLSLGISAIVLVDIAELILPLLIKRVMDGIEKGNYHELIPSTLVGLAIIITIQTFARYLWRMMIVVNSMRKGAALRNALASHLLRVSVPFYDRKKVGELMTLATSDIENMRLALAPAVIMLSDAIFYGVSIPLVMFYLAPDLAWKLILPVVAVPFLVAKVQGRIASISKQVQKWIGELSTSTQDTVAGIRVLRVFGAEPNFQNKLSGLSHELNRHQVQLARYQAAMGPMLEFWMSVSMVILLILSVPASVTVGTVVALQRYIQRLMWPLSAIGLAVTLLQRSKQSGTDYHEVLEVPREESCEESCKESMRLQNELKVSSGQKTILVIQNLNFSYGQHPNVIKSMNLTLKHGEWVGFEGGVGSGKSTLVALLQKFYAIERGHIHFLGKDLKDLSAFEVRAALSVVMQDPYLFKGSIRSNLDVGEELSIEEALKLVELEEWIPRVDTLEIGERGVGLSGGQKQRLAIARALRKPSLLMVFDDALSSVDSVTAQKVLKNLHQYFLSRQKTVLYFSHHPEHLKYCSRRVQLP